MDNQTLKPSQILRRKREMNFSITIPMQQNPVGVAMLREYVTDGGDRWKEIAPYFGAYNYLMYEYASGFTDWQIDWLSRNMTRRTFKKLRRTLISRKPLTRTGEPLPCSVNPIQPSGVE